MVNQVLSDIFLEFRDYLEEDREREALRKAGIDVSQMSRQALRCRILSDARLLAVYSI